MCGWCRPPARPPSGAGALCPQPNSPPQQFGAKFSRTLREIFGAFHMRSTGASSDPMRDEPHRDRERAIDRAPDWSRGASGADCGTRGRAAAAAEVLREPGIARAQPPSARAQSAGALPRSDRAASSSRSLMRAARPSRAAWVRAESGVVAAQTRPARSRSTARLRISRKAR